MSEPRPFAAKRVGQCADGSFIYEWCAGIKPGDLIVKRPQPALFDRPGRGMRGETSPTTRCGIRMKNVGKNRRERQRLDRSMKNELQ